MDRRLHLAALRMGTQPLSPQQAHHARDVLRLARGSAVEVFDDAGATASAIVSICDAARVEVTIDAIHPASITRLAWTVAAAIPKGERADWMVAKLAELGTSRFVPLLTDRGVVRPQGAQKIERWSRLAIEAAKQSRSPGLMRIDQPTTLANLLESLAMEQTPAWVLSLSEGAISPRKLLADLPRGRLALLVGPEGGWTDGESHRLCEFAAVEVRLTQTVLRVETAAIAIAALVATVAADRTTDEYS